MNERELLSTPEVLKLLDEIRADIQGGRHVKYIPDDVKEPNDLEGIVDFFICILFHGPAFEGDALFLSFENCLPEGSLRCKRTTVILRSLDDFLKRHFISDFYTLDKVAMAEVTRNYIQDLNILKMRYDCKTVQLPKIAGLMTNLIMRYRPVVPRDRNKNPIPQINEVFAVYHGLCLCSDFSNGDELEIFSKTDACTDFFEDMAYLLGRTFTAESLILTFKTLCLSHFPKFKDKDILG